MCLSGPMLSHWHEWDESDQPVPYQPREWQDPDLWGERELGDCDPAAE